MGLLRVTGLITCFSAIPGVLVEGVVDPAATDMYSPANPTALESSHGSSQGQPAERRNGTGARRIDDDDNGGGGQMGTVKTT